MTEPAPIVHSPGPVTLLGGAALPPGALAEALALAPTLVAADGGAAHALAHGLRPQAVIGDMDSLGAAARAAFADLLHPVAEQDTTDFEKALVRIRAPLVLALGFSGGRLDHELAALHALLARPDRPCVLVGPESLAALLPPALTLALAPGALVSLFPLAPATARSEGLRWPLDGLRLAAGERVGTSNVATGPVRLSTPAPGLALILPRPALPLLAAALPRAPRWPARAR